MWHFASAVMLVSAVAASLLFIHPYISYPITLRFLPKRDLRKSSSAPLPSAALVFCAYNEEASIRNKIENLRRVREVSPDIRFACYIDKSSDATLEIARQYPDLLEVYEAEERTGKAVGMAKLASLMTTEIMIFTDANVIVDPESIPRMLGYFSDPTVGGVAGRLVYTNEDAGSTAATSGIYWRLEEAIKSLESRSGSTMGADGSLFATRRSYYPVVPPHLLDDFLVSMSIVFNGLRLISAPDVLAYEESATSRAQEFRRKRRIACRAYASHRHILDQVLKLSLIERYKYFSHRVIRWYGGIVGAAAAVFFLGFIALEFGPLWAAAIVALGAGGFFLGSAAQVPLLSHGVEITSAIWATTLGVYDAMRGRTYQTWQPVTRT